jgi:signal transduction histidine kinase
MLKSLRGRLLAGMTGSLALLLGLFCAALYATIHHELRRQFDLSLETMVRTMAAAALVEKGVIEVELVPELVPDFYEPGHPLYYEYWVEDGEVLEKSASLGQFDLPHFHGKPEEVVIRSIQLQNGDLARAAGFLFRPAIEYALERPDGALRTPDTPMVTVVVARDARGESAKLARFAWLLLTAGTATMLGGLGISWLVAARGLRPLNTLAEQIAAVRAEHLDTHVSTEGVHTELVPVASGLNGLLERLEVAFRREKSITADVAHELRTPLSGIRSTIEVALTGHHHHAAEYREALEDSLRIVLQLQSLVENLLMLARLDAGHVDSFRELIQLSEVIEDCWRPLRDCASAKDVRVETRVPNDLMVAFDRPSVAILLRNVLHNAVEYVNVGGRISVEAREHDDQVELSVSNTGARLAESDVGNVFDRFWRGDRSRCGTGLHAGLGLALVRRLATVLGGDADVSLEQAIFTIRVNMPKVQQPKSAHVAWTDQPVK